MPGKSRRGKGKYAFQNKQQHGANRPGTPAQPAATQVQQSASVATATATVAPKARPRPVKATPIVKAPIRNPYVAKELRTIGIIAGAVLVILVILANVLR